jgi:hypothetical protein
MRGTLSTGRGLALCNIAHTRHLSTGFWWMWAGSTAYGLVHSLSHHIISVMSRLSGLDEGALGEYLFPVDLAFVIYRSGMTMDLGDLSSLWRNTWESFLNELRDYPRSLGCNVGSLCSEQGGACPDCLMIPEVPASLAIATFHDPF